MIELTEFPICCCTKSNIDNVLLFFLRIHVCALGKKGAKSMVYFRISLYYSVYQRLSAIVACKLLYYMIKNNQTRFVLITHWRQVY